MVLELRITKAENSDSGWFHKASHKCKMCTCGSTNDGINNLTCNWHIIQTSTPHHFIATVCRCNVMTVVIGCVLI